MAVPEPGERGYVGVSDKRVLAQMIGRLWEYFRRSPDKLFNNREEIEP